MAEIDREVGVHVAPHEPHAAGELVQPSGYRGEVGSVDSLARSATSSRMRGSVRNGSIHARVIAPSYWRANGP